MGELGSHSSGSVGSNPGQSGIIRGQKFDKLSMENRFDLSNDDDQLNRGQDQQQEFYLKTQKMEQDDAQIIQKY